MYLVERIYSIPLSVLEQHSPEFDGDGVYALCDMILQCIVDHLKTTVGICYTSYAMEHFWHDIQDGGLVLMQRNRFEESHGYLILNRTTLFSDRIGYAAWLRMLGFVNNSTEEVVDYTKYNITMSINEESFEKRKEYDSEHI